MILFRFLCLVLAGFWLLAGTLTGLGVLDQGLREGATILGFLMVGNGIGFALTGAHALRGRLTVDLFALVLTVANAILSVTDEIGPLDLVSLIISVTLSILILRQLPRAYNGDRPRDQ